MLFLLDFQFFQLFSDDITVAFGLHVFIDVEDFAVLADDECPAFWEFDDFGQESVGLCRLFVRIAQDRVVELELFGEFGVFFDGITTGCEEGDVEFL